MDFEDLERKIDESPPRVIGYPLLTYNDDLYEIERYLRSCMEERHLTLVRDMYIIDDEITDDENQKRENIIENYRDRLGFPKNILEFRKRNIKYNSWELGIALSNVLIGYLIGHKVKSPYVDHKVYAASGFFGALFFNFETLFQPVDEQEKKSNIKSFEATIMNWLDESDLCNFLKDTTVKKIAQRTNNNILFVVRRSFLISFKYIESKKGVDDENIIDENGNKILRIGSHTILLFWQARRTSKDDKIEYGIVDNLYSRKEHFYAFEEGLNLDFYDLFDQVFKKYCRKYIGQQQANELSMICLQNNIPSAFVLNKTYGKLDLTCFTQNRRMLIYFSLFYDINSVNNIIESKDEHHQFYDLFIVHTRMYIHHMNRMMHWLMTTKLIWPAKRQRTPNRHRPCCIVRPCHPFDRITMTEYYEKSLEDPRRHKLCVELNENTACLDFYNPVEGRKVKYWFKWDGENAFSAKEEYDRHCVVQAVVELLEKRVRLLV